MQNLSSSNYEVLIQKLDQFIRKYYLNQLLKGSLFLIATLTALFLGFSLLEEQFYFGKLMRKILFFSFFGVAIVGLWSCIINPLMHYFRLGKMISHEKAADIIGNHFAEVQDKLLNILQLKQQSVRYSDRELIEASINQKSSEIKLVSFQSAIDLSGNKRYLKYAVPPSLLLMGILAWAPGLIKEPTKRIIQNNAEFKKAAPYTFIIENPELKVAQNESFTLKVKTEGSVTPHEAFINIDNYQYRLQKEADDVFSYTFNNVQQNQTFVIQAGEVRSEENELKVILKPRISGFSVHLDYPAYTGKKDEQLQNVGDLTLPVGTKVLWNIETNNTDNMEVRFGTESKQVDLARRGEFGFQSSIKAMHDQPYTLFYSNEALAQPDSVVYYLHVIADQYPQIHIEEFKDSTNNKLIYFAGDASDDYGLVSVMFHYKIRSENGQESNINSKRILESKDKQTQIKHAIDINTYNLLPGQQLTYYFEVFDNDGVNGSKSTKSALMQYHLPSVEQLEQLEAQNNAEIKDQLEKSIEESKKIKAKLEELKNKLVDKKELEWQHKKDLEKLLEQQKKVQEQFEEAKKKFEENLKNQQEKGEQEEQLLNKQEQLQKLFNETANDEMKKLMEQIQQLMQELNKDQSIQMTEQFKTENQDLEKDMDRLLELFKQLEVEKDLREQLKKLDELAEKQEQLAEKTEEKKEDQQSLKEQQEEINKKFEDINKKLDDVKKKNEELERPKKIEDKKKEAEDIKKDLKDSKEQLSKEENEKAAGSQKKAAKKMKEMSEEMSEEMESGEEEENEEDIKSLRQLLENLVTLSFEQEDVIGKFENINPQTPKYTSLTQRQYKLKDDFRLIEDSLQELSKRVFAIQSFVMEKVAEVNQNFATGIDNLEERLLPQASDNQRRIMKNVNDLALMLSESLDNMQKEQNAQCNKPGSKSCKKPGDGKGKSGKQPKDKISQGQEKLGEEMKKMSQKLKESKGGKSSEDFAKMAAKQAALRKMLMDQEKEKREQGKGTKETQELIEEMNKIEKDLVNKQLNNETLKRQAEITTRLLEAERSEREREFDEKRKSETGTDIVRKFPASLEEYLRKRESETNWYKDVSPDLRPFFKKLVEGYYNNLKTQE